MSKKGLTGFRARNPRDYDAPDSFFEGPKDDNINFSVEKMAQLAGNERGYRRSTAMQAGIDDALHRNEAFKKSQNVKVVKPETVLVRGYKEIERIRKDPSYRRVAANPGLLEYTEDGHELRTQLHTYQFAPAKQKPLVVGNYKQRHYEALVRRKLAEQVADWESPDVTTSWAEDANRSLRVKNLRPNNFRPSSEFSAKPIVESRRKGEVKQKNRPEVTKEAAKAAQRKLERAAEPQLTFSQKKQLRAVKGKKGREALLSEMLKPKGPELGAKSKSLSQNGKLDTKSVRLATVEDSKEW